MTTFSWGENPRGSWTLKLALSPEGASDDEGVVSSWKLLIHGTTVSPYSTQTSTNEWNWWNPNDFWKQSGTLVSTFSYHSFTPSFWNLKVYKVYRISAMFNKWFIMICGILEKLKSTLYSSTIYKISKHIDEGYQNEFDGQYTTSHIFRLSDMLYNTTSDWSSMWLATKILLPAEEILCCQSEYRIVPENMKSSTLLVNLNDVNIII